MTSSNVAKGLVYSGLALMVVGAIDPLEGSLVILPGVALATAGVAASHGRFTRLMVWAAGLAAFGVGFLWLISAFGGFGGTSGRSTWWGLLLLPYPVGWLLALFGATRQLRAGFSGGAPPAPQVPSPST